MIFSQFYLCLSLSNYFLIKGFHFVFYVKFGVGIARLLFDEMGLFSSTTKPNYIMTSRNQVGVFYELV